MKENTGWRSRRCECERMGEKVERGFPEVRDWVTGWRLPSGEGLRNRLEITHKPEIEGQQGWCVEWLGGNYPIVRDCVT